VLPGRELEAAAGDHPRVLQVALAPAAIPCSKVDERGWALLVGTRQVWDHVDRPPSAPDERGLDEIVAQDVPAERRFALEVRQARMSREGSRSNDRIVAPIIAVASHPGRQARRDHGTVDTRCELLEAREEGVAVDDERQRLDDAGVGVRFHCRDEAHDALARHEAVRV
jgi:hypothetical protein